MQALASKKMQYEEKEELGDQIEALQKQINDLLKKTKDQKKVSDQAMQQVRHVCVCV